MKNALSTKIFNIKIKWMRHLSQTDQHYLDSKLTMKHLSLFNLLTTMKGRSYTENAELEKDLSVYLMMIMVMNSVTEEEKLLKEFEKYGPVPVMLYKLNFGVIPYKMQIDFFDICQKVGEKLQLAEIHEKAFYVQEKCLKKEVPKKFFEMFGDIVDYYALEILSYALIERQTLKQFDFEKELAYVFNYLDNKYYKKYDCKNEDEFKYQLIMKDYVKRWNSKMKKKAS